MSATLSFSDYAQVDIRVLEGTLGGDTYIIDGRPTCFAFTRRHYDAVLALTNEASRDYSDIKPITVNRLVQKKVLIVDEANCQDQYGWLGTKVWNANTEEYIGTVGDRCGRGAGYKTSHVDTAKCKFHVMASPAAKMSLVKTGKSAISLSRYLQNKVDKYLSESEDREQFLSLDRELALQRASLDMVVDFAKELEDPATNAIRISEHITTTVEKIGRQIERIQKMENARSLNASQVLYLQMVVAAIFEEYITDPVIREQAVTSLMDRIGTRNSIIDQTKPALMRIGT